MQRVNLLILDRLQTNSLEPQPRLKVLSHSVTTNQLYKLFRATTTPKRDTPTQCHYKPTVTCYIHTECAAMSCPLDSMYLNGALGDQPGIVGDRQLDEIVKVMSADVEGGLEAIVHCITDSNGIAHTTGWMTCLTGLQWWAKKGSTGVRRNTEGNQRVQGMPVSVDSRRNEWKYKQNVNHL